MTDADADIDSRPLTFGWEEWVALPGLGLPAVRAKVDTGARTSALHAFGIEPFGPASRPRVRFGVHPIPGRPDVEVTCAARLVGRREVMSSNGEAELRFVVGAKLEVAGRRWPIEVSLTNRDSMAYRMLIGRQAMEAAGVLVDPGRGLLQPKLSYRAYDGVAKRPLAPRPLRLALLTQNPGNYSSRRLIEAARARGHLIDPIETSRCYLNIDVRRPEVHYDGTVLPHYDAVIPRIGSPLTAYGLAVVRQFEMTGAWCLNRAASIGAARDKLHALQVMARKGVAMPVTAFAKSPKDTDHVLGVVGGAPLVVKLLQGSQGRGVVLAETAQAASSVISAFRDLEADILVQEFVAEAGGSDVRCFVIGSQVVAAMRRQAKLGDFRSNLHQGGAAWPVKITEAEQDLALRAVRALGLQVAGVDILRAGDGPKVIEVNASPGLQGIEQASGKDIATLIIRHVERRVRPGARSTAGAADRVPAEME
jgi:ribosomal protein S6--L-glutamate ligase